MQNLTYHKDKRITIRLNEKLYDYLFNASIIYDMTLSDYIRKILENDMILNNWEVSKNENNKRNIDYKL